MSSVQSRKRGASSPPPVQKRGRHSQVTESAPPVDQHIEDHDCTCSVEALLSVPLDVIFREVPSTTASTQRRKPLLTRSEAQCLLRTSQLAQEVDVLVNVASEALEHQWLSRLLSQRIEREANHPIMRPILPILAVHGSRVPKAAIGHVQVELNRVLHELDVCANLLRQFAEQNWTLSESLLDAFGVDDNGGAPSSGQELAHEKRIFGEIEEELFTRIEHLLSMATVTNLFGGNHDEHSTLSTENSALRGLDGQDIGEQDVGLLDAFDRAKDSQSGAFISMGEFCNRLLHQETVRTGRRSPINGTSSSVGEVYNGGSNSSTVSQKDEHGNGMCREESATLPASPSESQADKATSDVKKSRRGSYELSASSHVQRDEDMDPGAIGKRNELQRSLAFPLSESQNAAEALAVLASGSMSEAPRVSS